MNRSVPSGWMRLIACFEVAAFCGTAMAATVDFDREIKPLLSDRCYACHGPDEEARKAELRLDLRAGAFGPSSVAGRSVIAPGSLEQSELARRITAVDPDDRMPPVDSNLELTAGEISQIERWIEEGAQWSGHWAFEPVGKVAAPEVALDGWPRNEVDSFTLAKMESEGLAPLESAEKEILLRRVTFDLTGLPPTIGELDAFLADKSAGAYDAVVERLLASKRFGERMAAFWMDVARFADTHGYQADRYRSMWPWRDWVINAFNENLPYDNFILWQLAGDLLPTPTLKQQLATAFNRHHMQTEEGGSLEEEFRVAYVVDRVNTFGTAFLGLTLECARCHDHKFDPISQREYYQLFSFFNNIDESGQTSHFTDATPVPTLLLKDDGTSARLGELKERAAGLESDLRDAERQGRGAFEQWLREGDRQIRREGLVGAYAFDEIDKTSSPNAADEKKAAYVYESPESVPGKFGKAFKFSGENGVALKGVGAFRRADPFTLSLWLFNPGLERAAVLHRTKATLDAGSRGYELGIDGGKLIFGMAHMWPNNALRLESIAEAPVQEWAHVAVTYDGSSRASGARLFVNGIEQETEVVRDNLYKEIVYERIDVDLTVGERFRDNGFKGGAVDELKVYSRELLPVEIRGLAGLVDLGEWVRKAPDESREQGELEAYFHRFHNPIYRRALEELRQARAELNAAMNSVPEVMVMREMDEARPAYVLKRGAYDAPGERVSPATPEHILPFPEALPKNRLGLARWLLRPENPLTARVAVNHYWQLFFGRGLVVTAEDFGNQGEGPTHPELLDWLAGWFVESGWDVKALCRLIVTSATYQQSSEAPEELRARDPGNALLARGPKNRLTIEMIRDQALAVSGLLSPKIGGPSVKPYQPDGLWEEKSGARYDQGKGEDLYRRSLYTFWKRTSPHPAMMAFDAAERAQCVVRRQSTSTPLQALVLLNDVQFVEAAKLVGERTMKEGGSSDEERLVFMFRLLTSRRPAPTELEILMAMHGEQRDFYEGNPAAALELLAVGERLADPGLPASELAGLTMVANALLNHDETVMKR